VIPAPKFPIPDPIPDPMPIPIPIPVWIIPGPIPIPPVGVTWAPEYPVAVGVELFMEFDPTFLKELVTGSCLCVSLLGGVLKSDLVAVPNEERKLSMLMSVVVEGVGVVMDGMDGAE
jgi:hypothetical protein